MTTLNDALLTIGRTAGMDARVHIVKAGKSFRGTVYEALVQAPSLGFLPDWRVMCTGETVTDGRREYHITVKEGA